VTEAPGRPRDPDVTARVLGTALEVFAETGLEGLTMEELARRSTVPKSTIYRRWPSKSDLLADALLVALERDAALTSTASARRDLVELLAREARFLGTAAGRLLLQLVAQSLGGTELPPPVRAVVELRGRPFRELLAGCPGRGSSVRPERELAADVLVSAVWFRVLNHQCVDRRSLVHLAAWAQGDATPGR
jgi:AcrR family transcriptional regulator